MIKNMSCCSFSNKDICPICGKQLGSVFERTEIINNNHTKEVSILDELKEFRLSDSIKIDVTNLYQKLVDGKTKRNKPRRATIYHCLVSICKDNDIIFDRDEFRKMLNIQTRDINKASKTIKETCPNIDLSITIKDIIRGLLKQFDMKIEVLDEIMQTFSYCSQTSILFLSSKMETVASGLVFNYLNINLADFDQEKYFKNSKVSKDTILKVDEEILKYIQIEK